MDEISLLSQLLAQSRYEAGISQEQMALMLRISKQTVINWEKGLSTPKVEQMIEWFKVTGTNIFKPLAQLAYPEIYEDKTSNSEDSEIVKALHQTIDTLPPEIQKQSVYLFLGKHGSDPLSYMQLCTAYLHLPMQYRVGISRQIAEAYEMCEMRDELVCTDDIMPNLELLHRSIKMGKNAVKEGKKGYNNT